MSFVGHNNGAVAAFGMLVAVLGCSTFGPGETIPPTGETLWHVPNIRAAWAAGFDDASVYVVDTSRTLRALSRTDGRLLWSLPLDRVRSNSHVGATGGVVLAASGPLVAIDATTRTELWRSDSREGLGERPFATLGNKVFPTVYRGVGDALALDARTGAELWRVNILPRDTIVGPGDAARTHDPAIHGDLLAYPFTLWRGATGPEKAGLALVEASTGRLRWTQMLPTQVANASTLSFDAAVNENVAIMASSEGYVYAYSVASGALLWTGAPARPLGGGAPATPDTRAVLLDGTTALVASASGILTAHDAQTGAVRWRIEMPNGGINALRKLKAGKVLTHDYSLTLTAVEVSTGRIVWRTRNTGGGTSVYVPQTAQDTIFAAGTRFGVVVYRVP